MKIAWFHCFSGIAGDMALGSLIDAGADLEEVKKMCSALDLDSHDGSDGYEITARPTMRNGITGTHIKIEQTDQTPPSRNATAILALIKNAELPERVKQRSLKTFQILAEAEGKLHGKPASEVHFHEVGSIDSIIDIVGTCAALECLEIEAIYSSPVAHGIGTIECEHGTMPNPPPAVVEILKGVPIYGVDIAYELTTPTGAALLKALVEEFSPIPEMEVISTGFGAGSKEFPQIPNMTQVVIGESSESSQGLSNLGQNRGQPVVVLETNLDDITGEVLADTIAKLLSAGALDVWVTPILMKKGRPAHTISALVDISEHSKITNLLIKLTGTLGVRSYTVERWPQPREFETISVEGHLVRVKVRVKVRAGKSTGNSESDSESESESQSESQSEYRSEYKPEYEDLAKVAEATGKSLKEIQLLATQAYNEQINKAGK